MNSTLICIISSEKTWQNFSKYGFSEKIKAERKNIDFAVTLNGYGEEAIEYFKTFTPDYFFLRPNAGFDPAAIAHLIKLIPVYDTTLIVHDDHWFEDENWLERIIQLTHSDETIGVWGNVVYHSPKADFEKFCKDYQFEYLLPIQSNRFLHGVSGIFSSQAIKKLKQTPLPFPNSTEKQIAELGEHIFSSVLRFLKIQFEQIPEGIFKFLQHGNSSKRDSIFWTANSLVYKHKYQESLQVYFEYLDYCEKNNFHRDLPIAYYNIAFNYFLLEDYKNAVIYSKKCLEIVPDCSDAFELLQMIKEKLNV